jgi:soluble lytic murein transglycosylase-like protein
VNGPCFAGRPTIDELKDPEFNVKFGTRMVATLVKRHGDLREALKAYGPMNSGYSYADKVLQLYKQFGG